MINDDTRRTGHHGRPPFHSHHTDDTLSVERPGSRRMRGLGGRLGGHGRRPVRTAAASRCGAASSATRSSRLLAEQPMHGYQVMQELSERSGGRWHPSAGSIYPTLQQLEDEGLVTAEDRDGRKTFSLTEAGQAAAKAVPADRPWTRHEGRNDLGGAHPRAERRGHPGEPGRLARGARRGRQGPHRRAARPLPAPRRRRRRSRTRSPRPDRQTGVARTSVRASARPPVHGWP